MFTHVDENTVVYGGRNENTFALGRDAVFRGTIIGGSGRKNIATVLLPAFSALAGTPGKGVTVQNTVNLIERAGTITEIVKFYRVSQIILFY